MSEELPYSQASENNKQAILAVLKKHIRTQTSILEIGGGTGQHAVFFADQFPHLSWQSTDIPENVHNLNLRILQTGLSNTPKARSLDVNDDYWLDGSLSTHSSFDEYDAAFTANSLHIMSEQSVENFFFGIKTRIKKNGLLIVYGPFKYQGEFTSDSNAQFDVWLKDRNPVSGVRDFEQVNRLAEEAGLQLIEDNPMPANNQLLVWSKQS